MARFANVDRNPVDRAVDTWRDDCLVSRGSLLFPGESLWTPERFDELVENFSERQLTDKRSFEDKLTEQLTAASREAGRLMAEVIAVYFLFSTSVGGHRKREVINAALGVHGDELSDDSELPVARAMDTGIGNPGQFYNSGRPTLLIYLVAFGRRFMSEDDDTRRRLLADAWDFKRWLVGDDDQADGGEQMMRQILLHLLFPEAFERIASGTHKWKIAETFGPLVDGDEDEDIDRRLLAIRERITELLPGGQEDIGGAIDFYAPPLEEGWDPDRAGDSEDEAGLSHLGALEHKKQVVLYGPPGTGKTYEAKALAVQLLRHQALVRWGPSAFLRNLDLIDELAEKQVHRLQLHQSYSYEEFIRGQKLTATGTRPDDGYLLRLIDHVRTAQKLTASGEPLPEGVVTGAPWSADDGDLLRPLPWVLVLDELNRTDLSRLLGEAFSILEDRESAVELSTLNEDGSVRRISMPSDLFVIGTMNLIDQSVEQLDFALRRRFLWLYSGFDREVIREVVRQRWDAYALGHHPFERLQHDVELLAERAAELNAEVSGSKLLGQQYEVGHTYFFDAAGLIRRWPKVRTKGRRPARYLWKDDGTPLPPARDLWAHSLRPLLEEYLAGVEPQARQREVARLSDIFLWGGAD